MGARIGHKVGFNICRLEKVRADEKENLVRAKTVLSGAKWGTDVLINEGLFKVTFILYTLLFSNIGGKKKNIICWACLFFSSNLSKSKIHDEFRIANATCCHQI